ncbi:hypothetical protein B0H13DRAFT_2345547 [Mycena leptocephala]|nr:hypothetical protein B0H13DRAFT_2345547 [Mycena leptocephala]
MLAVISPRYRPWITFTTPPRLPTPLPVLASPSAGHYHVIQYAPMTNTIQTLHRPARTRNSMHQPAVHPGLLHAPPSTCRLSLNYRSHAHARASRAPRYTHTSNTPRTPGTRRPAVDPKLCVTAPGPARVHPSTPCLRGATSRPRSTCPARPPFLAPVTDVHRSSPSNQRDAGGRECVARCPHCRNTPSLRPRPRCSPLAQLRYTTTLLLPNAAHCARNIRTYLVLTFPYILD